VDFDVRSAINPILCIRQILEKKREYNGTVHQLFVDFKKTYDSVRREVLYNVLIKFGTHAELVTLIKICLNGTHSFCPMLILFRTVRKKEMILDIYFNFDLEFASGRFMKIRKEWN
jgi:hypothetical protein